MCRRLRGISHCGATLQTDLICYYACPGVLVWCSCARHFHASTLKQYDLRGRKISKTCPSAFDPCKDQHKRQDLQLVVGGGDDDAHADMARRRTSSDVLCNPCSCGGGRGDPESNTNIIPLKTKWSQTNAHAVPRLFFFTLRTGCSQGPVGLVCGSNTAPSQVTSVTEHD